MHSVQPLPLARASTHTAALVHIRPRASAEQHPHRLVVASRAGQQQGRLALLIRHTRVAAGRQQARQHRAAAPAARNASSTG